MWSSEQEESFNRIKQAITETPVLRYFDPSLPLEGQGDASSKGLGFSLLQEGQPVTYASRTLTSAEQRYAQIEKELLALVFGMERNHQYAYGRRVILWSDHKPLISIWKKPLRGDRGKLSRVLSDAHNFYTNPCSCLKIGSLVEPCSIYLLSKRNFHLKSNFRVIYKKLQNFDNDF